MVQGNVVSEMLDTVELVGEASNKNKSTSQSRDDLSGGSGDDINDDEEKYNNRSNEMCLSRGKDRITGIIQQTVVTMSVHAAKYPYWYIFSTVVISFTLLIAGSMTNLVINVNPDELFTPRNTITGKHMDWISNYNPYDDNRRLGDERDLKSLRDEMNVDDYDETLLAVNDEMMNMYNFWPLQVDDTNQNSRMHGRKIQQSMSSGPGSNAFSLLVHANGQNVVEQEGIRTLFQAVNMVKEIVPRCRQNPIYSCRENSALHLWNYNITLFEETVHSDQDVVERLSRLFYPEDGEPVDLRSIAGNAEVSANGTIVSAQSYIVIMNVPSGANRDIIRRNFAPPRKADIEKQVIESLLAFREDLARQNSKYTVELFSRRGFEDELFKSVSGDMPLIPFVFLLMIAFTCLTFFKWDRVKSKCLLGLGGVITIFFSIATGYGLMFCFAMPFTPMTSMLPFVVLGIGLDDTFIISLAFNRTDEEKDPVERIRETMNDIGLSISVTTITTTLAFAFGCISTIASIYWLCMYAVVTIVIDFIYQITFFVALVVLDARRIQANRTDFCTCFSAATSSTSSPSTSEGEQINILPSSNTGEGEQIDMLLPSNTGGPDENQTAKRHFADRFMSYYAKQLLRPRVKAIVIAVFLTYLAVCTYCTTLMRQEFRISDLTPNGSYIRAFFRAMQDLTTRTTAAFIYFRNVDQSDPEVRQQMINYIDDLVAIPAFGEQPPFCWVRDIDPIVEIYQNGQDMFSRVFQIEQEEASFSDQVQYVLNTVPVLNSVYSWQLLRDQLGTIKASRCIIWLSNLDLYDVQDQMDTMRAQRELSMAYANGEEEWPFFTFQLLYFIWEFYEAVVNELILTTLSAVIAVSLVALLVVPHWSAVLYVLPMVAILYIDLIGTLQFIGVRINGVSYVALVISIGVMVDFILHVLMRYYESKCKTREEKTIDALETMGSSILLGGLSTFIATIPVLFASSKIFKDIFDAFFAIVVLSVCHGLIFLPVILSIVGPTGGENQIKEVETDSDKEECSMDQNHNIDVFLSPIAGSIEAKELERRESKIEQSINVNGDIGEVFGTQEKEAYEDIGNRIIEGPSGGKHSKEVEKEAKEGETNENADIGIIGRQSNGIQIKEVGTESIAKECYNDDLDGDTDICLGSTGGNQVKQLETESNTSAIFNDVSSSDIALSLTGNAQEKEATKDHNMEEHSGRVTVT